MNTILQRHGRQAGFTLVELVVVIVISGVIASMVSTFIAQPVQAYVDLNRRATLVDAADSALRRMARDVRRALPNSVRINAAGDTIELLNTLDGARYRDDAGGAHGSADDLWQTGGDDRFNVLGRLQSLNFTYGSALPAGVRAAIYTTDASVYADAATGAEPGVITPASTQITISNDGNEDKISLLPAFDFALASPGQRLYLLDSPVTYRCDITSGTLTRYSGYTITSGQPTDPAASPLDSASSSALVADHISACAFSYDPGAGQRGGLVTAALTLADHTGERVTLLHQIHVDNLP